MTALRGVLSPGTSAELTDSIGKPTDLPTSSHTRMVKMSMDLSDINQIMDGPLVDSAFKVEVENCNLERENKNLLATVKHLQNMLALKSHENALLQAENEKLKKQLGIEASSSDTAGAHADSPSST